MAVHDSRIKVGRSHDFPRRSWQLCARVLRIWPGLGHLEAQVHRLLDEFVVTREVFCCPPEAVDLVVDHSKLMDDYINREQTSPT